MLHAPLKHDDRSVSCRIRSSEETLTVKRFALDEGMDSHSVMQASPSAPPDGYRSALQLDRLILLGANIAHAGRLGGQTFALSLSRIWEDAVAQTCRDLELQTGWRVEPKSIRPWGDAISPDDKYRSLIADTLLKCGSDRWVLDAKYKRGYGNEDRNDRFQMCAYAAGFQAARATLVYPTLLRSKIFTPCVA